MGFSDELSHPVSAEVEERFYVVERADAYGPFEIRRFPAFGRFLGDGEAWRKNAACVGVQLRRPSLEEAANIRVEVGREQEASADVRGVRWAGVEPGDDVRGRFRGDAQLIRRPVVVGLVVDEVRVPVASGPNLENWALRKTNDQICFG